MSRSRQRCRRNCKDPTPTPPPSPVPQASSKAVGKYTGAKLDPQVVTVAGEAERLWNHALFGTGTCVGILAGYAALEMPGNPIEGLQSLIARLQDVVRTVQQNEEKKNNHAN